MQPLFLFQAPDTASAVASQAKSFSLFSVIVKSGPIGIGIVIALIILAVMAVYILVERHLTIKRAGEVDQNFMSQIRTAVLNGNIEGAKAICNATDTPVARMVAKGLQRIGKPLEDISAAVENVGNLEVYKLEKRISTLATISGAAPMIGFFGTVTGMITAFYEMSSSNNVTPQLLAGGIYQALITTAFGLVIGIIAFVGYNSLIASVDRVVFKMEAATVDFLDLLQEPA